jgi:hypothetical protein
MSIWISRAAAVLIPALLCAACVPVGGGGGALPRSADFLNGDLRVAAPQGYCIDTRASHETGDGAVVLMGRCSESSAAAPGLITLTAGAPGSSDALKAGGRALTDYFTSAAGRAALARDGRASSVRVKMVSVADGALVLNVSDRTAGDYWRAILGVKGRLVSISVTAPGGGALPEGRAMLDKAVAAFRAANATAGN